MAKKRKRKKGNADPPSFCPWMARVGLCDEDDHEECRCPPECRELCARLDIDVKRLPRRLGEGTGDDREFTSIVHDVLRGFGGLPEGYKGDIRTYMTLLSYTSHHYKYWVFASAKTLAMKRFATDKPTPTQQQRIYRHLARLEQLGLIIRVPRVEVDPDYTGKLDSYVICSQPDWMFDRHKLERKVAEMKRLNGRAKAKATRLRQANNSDADTYTEGEDISTSTVEVEDNPSALDDELSDTTSRNPAGEYSARPGDHGTPGAPNSSRELKERLASSRKKLEEQYAKPSA